MLFRRVARPSVVLFWVVGTLLFRRRDLATLRRPDAPRLVARLLFRHGGAEFRGRLVLLTVAGLVFVAIGTAMLWTGENSWLAGFVIAYFGLCRIATAYTLTLKLTKH